MSAHPQSAIDESIKSWLISVLSGKIDRFPDELEPLLDQCVAFAKQEGVRHLVYEILESHLNNDAFHEHPFIRAIEPERLHLQASELLRYSELTEIFQEFQRHDLDFLLLKGEALAFSVYPSPESRERSDTDLLLRDQSSVDTAWEILRSRGYTRQPTLRGKFVGYQYNCIRTLAADVAISLDIHRKVSDYLFFANRLDFDELFANRQPTPGYPSGVTSPDNVFLLLHALIHRISNLPSRQQDRLIWLYDIKLLTSKLLEEDWQRFIDIAIEKKLAGICLHGLTATHDILRTSIDNNLLQQLETASQRETFRPHEASNRLMIYFADFKQNPGALNKIQQIREHLFPPLGYMRERFGLTSNIQAIAYYPIRWFSGVGKYLSR